MKKKSKKKHNKKTSLHNKVTEDEFLEVLENISKRLGHKFKFGYHSYEDMKQQAAIFALEGLEKYDNTRPLENFLWTHVRNRLFNFKRDNYQRPDKPCLTCPFYDPNLKNSMNQCEKYTDKNNCSLYSSWDIRNSNKKNIMKPVGIDEINESSSTRSCSKKDVTETLFNKEVIDLLDAQMPSQYREIYLRYKYGEKINKSDLNKMLKAIKLILENDNE